MNNKLLFYFTCLLLFGFIGCGKVSTPFMDSDVSLVKDGTLRFDKSLKLGQAIDNYKYFKNVKWSSITSDNGKRIVSVIADIDMDKMRPDWENMVKKVSKEGALKFRVDESISNNILSYLLNQENKIRALKIEIQFIINVDKTFNLGWEGFNVELFDGSKINSNSKEGDIENTFQKIYANEPLQLPLGDIPETTEKQEEQPRNHEAPVGSADAPAIPSSQAAPPAIPSSSAPPAAPVIVPAPAAVQNKNNNDEYVDIIKNFIAAEDRRDIRAINTYLSEHIERYWDILNPNYEEINDRYSQSWNKMGYSKNHIINITRQNETTFVLFTRFEFVRKGQQKVNIKDNRIVIVFDNEKKIIEIYGVD